MVIRGQNVAGWDRALRIVLGGGLIALRYLGGFAGIVWDLLVIYAASTIWEGLLGYCLLYGVLRVGTLRERNTSS